MLATAVIGCQSYPDEISRLRSGRLFSEALGWPYIAPWSTFLEVSVSRASANTVFSEAAGLRRQPVAEISGRI